MNKYIKIVFLLLLLISFTQCYSQDSSFILTTGKTKGYFPCYIGNGHFSSSSSPLGTKPSESYMIKVYDKGKNDIPRIAALPEWNEINYFDGNKWLNDLNVSSNDISSYSQTLDMQNGLLHTHYTWSNSSDRKSDIDIVSFVSRSNKNLAVIKFEITPNFSDDVKLSFPIKERQKPKRIELAVLKKINFPNPNDWPYFWYPGFVKIKDINGEKNNYSAKLWASAQSVGKNTKLGLASEIFTFSSSANFLLRAKFRLIKRKISNITTAGIPRLSIIIIIPVSISFYFISSF